MWEPDKVREGVADTINHTVLNFPDEPQNYIHSIEMNHKTLDALKQVAQTDPDPKDPIVFSLYGVSIFIDNNLADGEAVCRDPNGKEINRIKV